MPGETGENRPSNGMSNEEITKATKLLLKKLRERRMKSYDERIGNQPTERELAENALRKINDKNKLPVGPETDKQVEEAQSYLDKLRKNPAGRSLFKEISKKLRAEQKEK